MNIDLSKFKVVYGESVLNAVAIIEVMWRENDYPDPQSAKTIIKPQFLSVLAINNDGNIIAINDEAWRFQFIPIVTKEG